MNKSQKDIISKFMKKIGSKGGSARAERHSKAELSRWAQLGGRPKTKTTNRGESK